MHAKQNNCEKVKEIKFKKRGWWKSRHKMSDTCNERWTSIVLYLTNGFQRFCLLRLLLFLLFLQIVYYESSAHSILKIPFLSLTHIIFRFLLHKSFFYYPLLLFALSVSFLFFLSIFFHFIFLFTFLFFSIIFLCFFVFFRL